MVSKGSEIRSMLESNLSYREIEKKLGVSRATISYHACKIGHQPKNPKATNRYDWKAVEDYYQTHSYTETVRHFKMGKTTLWEAIKRGIIQRIDHRISVEQLIKRPTTARSHLKDRLIRDGHLEVRCYAEGCTLSDEWNGKPLNLHLDHINGRKNDNRLENLRLLCPNCHSQTKTYGGRNIQRNVLTCESINPK